MLQMKADTLSDSDPLTAFWTRRSNRQSGLHRCCDRRTSRRCVEFGPCPALHLPRLPRRLESLTQRSIGYTGYGTVTVLSTTRGIPFCLRLRLIHRAASLRRRPNPCRHQTDAFARCHDSAHGKPLCREQLAVTGHQDVLRRTGFTTNMPFATQDSVFIEIVSTEFGLNRFWG